MSIVKKNILLIEPFFTGSHRQWAEGYQQHSQHQVDILSLPGRHWKWRMFGGAVSLAQQFLQSNFQPDLILASDMLDLSTFLALSRNKTAHLPTVLYFHENQITYPWSPDDPDVALQRHNEYGFINYTSALAADRIVFNSNFHQTAFLQALPGFLQQFPDHRGMGNVSLLQDRSSVLPLGLDLSRFDPYRIKKSNRIPVLLWNHRWEYDKNPDAFYQLLRKIRERKFAFQLVLLGESYAKSPSVFQKIQEEFSEELLHCGYAKDFATYARWLCRADILPVSSQQDFFGGSIVEAIYCGVYPILPFRLAYPEHIPTDLQADCFYQNESDFLDKTLLAMKRKSDDRLQNFVGRYDWSNLALAYDQFFSSRTK